MHTSPIVGRLAPSPTGELHLGHARSFLLAWWSARAAGGRVVLRWEDIGSDRVRPEFVQAMRTDLAWLGLDHDGEEVVQSARLGPIRSVIDGLLARGAVYPCICSRSAVRAAQDELAAPHPTRAVREAHTEAAAPSPRSAPVDRSTRTDFAGPPELEELFAEPEPAYPGTCRGRFGSLGAALAELAREGHGQRAPALRFDVARAGSRRRVHDAVWGAVEVDLAVHGGDFVVARGAADGAHEVGYQVAVVVDDAADGVNEVVRGVDLMTSAARQELIAEAAGLPSPKWAHVPLVTDAEGQRLAKRTRAASLEHLRAAGVAAADVVRWAAVSAGLVPAAAAGELHAAPDALARLDPREPLGGLARSPVVLPDFDRTSS